LKRATKDTSINISVYADYVTRGPRFQKDGKVFQQKVGAVVAVVDGDNLKVGWSLCFAGTPDQPGRKRKEGDRFSPEIAMSLAEGRARQQHSNSIKYGKLQVPSTVTLMKKGVPQSCLKTMSGIISRAIGDHPEIRRVVIFNTKTEKKDPTPQLMW
jgi:hypothetical protein